MTTDQGEIRTNQTITLDQFKSAPEIMEEHQGEEMVSRANFVSVLLKSFEYAEDKAFRQGLYFEWLELKTSFSMTESIGNYLKAGASNCLSETEKERIVDFFANFKFFNTEDIDDVDFVTEYWGLWNRSETIIDSFTEHFGELSNMSEEEMKEKIKLYK